MMKATRRPLSLSMGPTIASKTSAFDRRPCNGQPAVSRCLVNRRLDLLRELRVALAAMIDSVGQGGVDRNVVPDGLLELAMEPIDLPQRRRVVADSASRLRACSGQLAVGVVATFDEREAGLDQAPLRLALALADPDRAAMPRDDRPSRRRCRPPPSACTALREGRSLLEGEGVATAEVREPEQISGRLSSPFDGLGALDVFAPCSDRCSRRASHRSSTKGRASPGARGHVGERVWKSGRKVEGELAEQHEAPELVGDGRQGLALGHQLEAEGLSTAGPSPPASSPRSAFSASVCSAVGARSARMISRVDSAFRQVRSVGQLRPPPTLSIKANDGDGFSANSRRISVALSGFAFRQMLS